MAVEVKLAWLQGTSVCPNLKMLQEKIPQVNSQRASVQQQNADLAEKVDFKTLQTPTWFLFCLRLAAWRKRLRGVRGRCRRSWSWRRRERRRSWRSWPRRWRGSMRTGSRKLLLSSGSLCVKDNFYYLAFYAGMCIVINWNRKPTTLTKSLKRRWFWKSIFYCQSIRPYWSAWK